MKNTFFVFLMMSAISGCGKSDSKFVDIVGKNQFEGFSEWIAYSEYPTYHERRFRMGEYPQFVNLARGSKLVAASNEVVKAVQVFGIRPVGEANRFSFGPFDADVKFPLVLRIGNSPSIDKFYSKDLDLREALVNVVKSVLGPQSVRQSSQ